jgi:hypothetical protein
MRKALLVRAILFFGVSISLTMGAQRVAAQGPAGEGATAVQQDNARSLNPIKWVKKDSKNSTDTPGSRSDAEKKLTPNLQAQGVLAANVSATDACAPFASLAACLAALHASHNLGVEFNCLRAAVTGVHTSTDLSGCKVTDAEKALELNKAVHQVKPDANAKQAAKEAERQAKDDLNSIRG